MLQAEIHLTAEFDLPIPVQRSPLTVQTRSVQVVHHRLGNLPNLPPRTRDADHQVGFIKRKREVWIEAPQRQYLLAPQAEVAAFYGRKFATGPADSRRQNRLLSA